MDAISGFIPDEIRNEGFYQVEIAVRHGWTEFGIDEHGKQMRISDTQRYRCCGNAVSVPVVLAIVERLSS
jgi:site-specific DNA-cytosine methylase